MTLRRPGTPLLCAALMLLLATAAAGLTLLTRLAVADVPLDSHIPNEQALIDVGLSSVPGPDQPTRPIAVDRVLVDGAATYVQYHRTGSLSSQSNPIPAIFDDQGTRVYGGYYGGFSSSSGWTLPLALPFWVPWHPQTTQRGYAILGPLPASARGVVLQFDGSGGSSGPGGGETVRVPLGRAAPTRRRVTHPGLRARDGGIALTLRDLAFTHASYTYTQPLAARSSSFFTHIGYTAYFSAPTFGHASFPSFPPSGQLVDGASSAAPATAIGTDCTAYTHGMSCTTRVAFPPQRHGARLTLTISSVQMTNTVRHGHWRFSVIIP